MAGIYLHIPFCKQACHYCDFHFSTSLKYKDDLLRAMHRELELRKGLLGNQSIETIYFGGGTPSILGADEIQRFLDSIGSLYPVAADAEITLEANPDDLDAASVKELRKTAINRFSIGVQSFFEDDLRWMNRAHSASEAESSVKRVQDAGFENITIDLIYGFPILSNQKWQGNMEKTISLDVPHISAYSMTVEQKTALAHFIKKGKEPAMADSQGAEQFLMLSERLEMAGYEHYEISNFAKPGRYSRHNSNYWRGIPYLGIGPSAHSYNGEMRFWNIANNSKYIQSLIKDIIPAESEILRPADKCNEYVMTSLRTIWGIDLQKIETEFGLHYRSRLEEEMTHFLDKGWIARKGEQVYLTKEGKLFADHIAAELFVEEN